MSELEQGGYITRVSDTTDKRATLIQFTEAGRQLLEVAYQIKLEIEAEYTTTLGQANMEILRNLLETLLQKNA